MKNKKQIKLRVVFMGTSAFARKILEFLVDENFNVVAVYTSPDALQGRNFEMKGSVVKTFADEKKIRVFQPMKFDEEEVKNLKNLKPDLILVADYGKILPATVLSVPGFGCLNVHASLLPKLRGPSPVQNALLSGEKETGITVILMNRGIDTGDIIASRKIEIGPDETTMDLLERLSDLSLKVLAEVIPLWVERKIKPQPQDDLMATVCQLIEREDGRIIWEEEAQIIYNKYRAFYPWPGIFCFWKNKETLERIKLLKISLAAEEQQSQRRPGEVFRQGDLILVQTLKNCVNIKQLQLEGKKPVSAADFVNGYPNFIGSVLT